jgi:seryl-tRNA synthetase
MIRIVSLVALVLALGGAARAQDVQGIELCTREASMDRRTSCLQSNVQYLQGVIAKNAAEARQKLGAAAGEIGALKAEVAGLKGEVATLKAALAAVQARLDKPETAAKPAVKPGISPGNSPANPADKPATPATK